MFLHFAHIPLFFVRGGGIGSVSYAWKSGFFSLYWGDRSAKNNEFDRAVQIAFDDSTANSNDTNYRWSGLSLRCLVVGKV